MKKCVPVRKTSLRAPEGGGDLKDKTPEQLLGTTWQLALDAWGFKDNLKNEPRLQRHVLVIRRLKN
jgi:hypothetical protein